MKRLFTLALAVVGSGCATNGSVEAVSRRLDALGTVVSENEVAMGSIVKDLESMQRDLRSFTYRINDMQHRLDRIDAGTPAAGNAPDLDRLIQDPNLQPGMRDKLTAYFTALPKWAPEKAQEASLDFPAEVILPRLVASLRFIKEESGRKNAAYVLERWKPSEAAPHLERALSDGLIRGQVLVIYDKMDPHDEVRKALLKHATEGDESWRIAVACSLARAQAREGVKTLIEFLFSEDAGRRSQAIEGLKSATGFDLGYRMYAGPDERKASAEKWRQWWSDNEDSFVFPKR